MFYLILEDKELDYITKEQLYTRIKKAKKNSQVKKIVKKHTKSNLIYKKQFVKMM